MMYCTLILIIFTLINAKTVFANIENDVGEYFKTENIYSFQKEWQIQRKAYENSVLSALSETFGKKSFNIFGPENGEDVIANSFFLTDNVIDLLLLNMKFRELPPLNIPEVTLQLPFNAIRFQAILGKIIVDSYYLQFRNQSQVLYQSKQDPDENTPFSFQQVQDAGKVVIVAEDCGLSGEAVVRLKGQSVNLGHDTFRVSNCTFSIEISGMGTHTKGVPPVIAPYFSEEQRNQLEILFTKPIREELVHKLQGILYNYVNTTAIFNSNLPKYKLNQENIFTKTSEHIKKAIDNMNQITVKNNQGSKRLPDISVEGSLDDVRDVHKVSNLRLAISRVTLYGLDTAYSTYTGGPYKLDVVKIGETIKYSSLQIRGTFHYENMTHSDQHAFSAELLDVTVNVLIRANPMKSRQMSKQEKTIQFVDWRAMEFSISDYESHRQKRIVSHAFIASYLINEIPKCVVNHMSHFFEKPLQLDTNITDSQEADNVPKNTEEIEQPNSKDSGNSSNSAETERHSSNDNRLTGSETDRQTEDAADKPITFDSKSSDEKENTMFSKENKQFFSDQFFTDKNEKEMDENDEKTAGDGDIESNTGKDNDSHEIEDVTKISGTIISGENYGNSSDAVTNEKKEITGTESDSNEQNEQNPMISNEDNNQMFKNENLGNTVTVSFFLDKNERIVNKNQLLTGKKNSVGKKIDQNTIKDVILVNIRNEKINVYGDASRSLEVTGGNNSRDFTNKNQNKYYSSKFDSNNESKRKISESVLFNKKEPIFPNKTSMFSSKKFIVDSGATRRKNNNRNNKSSARGKSIKYTHRRHKNENSKKAVNKRRNVVSQSERDDIALL